MGRKKKLLVLMSSVFLFAGTAPQVGDTVELEAWLNARSSASFRKIDRNVQRTLKPGTKGRIAKSSHIKRFATGNYGICLTLENSENSPCSWVYYRVRQPNMKLLNRAQEVTRQPESASAAVVVTPTRVVIDEWPAGESPYMQNQSPANHGMDSDFFSQVVDGFNRWNNGGRQFGADTSPVCTDCENKPLRPYAESCSILNNYIEKELIREKANRSLLGELISGAAVRPTIKLACVQATIALNPGIRHVHCGPGDKSTRRMRRAKPCQSENYVKAIGQSLNLVSNCFKGLNSRNETEFRIRSESTAKLMMWESSMQMNAVSGTNAGGMGQLTTAAIADTNRILIDKIKGHFAASSDPLCQRLATETLSKKMDAQPGQSCERIAVSEGSPLKNMIYTYGFQMLARKHLDDFVFSDRRIQNFLSDLSAAERESVQNNLAIWSHNTGPGGMQTPLMGLLISKARAGGKLQANEIQQFYNEVKQRLASNPHPANASSARRKETSTFFGAIQGRAAMIEESAGGSCLVQ